MKDIKQIREFARNIRISAVKMVHKAKASHIGGAFSMADILAVLYCSVLKIDPKNPSSPDRDRLILSKGHTCSVLYAALAEAGFFPKEQLDSYCINASPLAGHITKSTLPGIELSTGSLGHGLPVACGMALAAKRGKSNAKFYVIMGDGECDEGSNWEALLFAAHHHLDNLVIIIDCNGIQSLGRTSEVMGLEPLVEKLKAFNWSVQEINGNDVGAVLDALSKVSSASGKPYCIVARTIKGKGVSFMEDKLLWHYRSPSDEDLKIAISELESAL